MYRMLFLALKKVQMVKITSRPILTSQQHNWTHLPLKSGEDLPKIESFVGGSTKFLSRKGDKHEKGGDVKMGGLPLLIILYFSHIYGVCGKREVSFNNYFNNTVSQSFELANARLSSRSLYY